MDSLSEFFYKQNQDEFEDQQDADIFLTELFSGAQRDDKHYGDCVKQNCPCLMCELTQVLNDYWEYTKQNRK